MGTHVWREMEFSQDASADTQPSLLMLLEQLDYQQGEKRLMLAVLKDAVECIEHYSSGRGAQSLPVYRAALRWVFTRDQKWPFSFENICLALDLDPARLRFTLCSPLPLRSVSRKEILLANSGGGRPTPSNRTCVQWTP